MRTEPGSVAFYNIWPGNKSDLIWFHLTAHTGPQTQSLHGQTTWIIR